MNNSLNAPQNPNELVLRLIGGERDGQFFSVKNEKCLLSGLLPGDVDSDNYRCVIFRGEKGVAFRSYSDHVLCNGAKVSVQWLKKGDLIKLTDRFSVEVYQLGTYTKKPAAAPAASRVPVHTVEMPSTVAPTPSNNAPVAKPPVVTRQESSTVVSNAPAVTTPLASVSGQVAPPTDFAKSSSQFPSVSASTAGKAPKFKPATENLRIPAVTAPLPNHQVPAESSVPAASVSRMPVVTKAIDAVPSETNAPTKDEAENQSVNTYQSPEAPSTTTLEAAPSNSTIDALSERLSKLVDSAGGNGDIESGDNKSIEPPSSNRPSVSTMPIEPAITDPANKETKATPEAPALQSPSVAQPETPSISAPNTERIASQTIQIPPVAPITEAADGDSSTNADPQPSTGSSSGERRSALESYFSKSGVSLSDTASPPEEESTLANSVSQKAAQVEPAAPIAPEASVEAPVTPTAPSTQTVVTEGIKKSPEFNLDAVLADLESKSSASALQTPAVAPAQDQQPPVVEAPVVEAPVVETPVVETPVVETPVVEDAFEQPPVATNNKDESSPETANKDQGGQLESFALLQSLGLDTSGLSQIKKELTEAPSSEEVESITSDAAQQAGPDASEPEASAPPKIESVADVLARMQNSGSLQDFKAGEEAAEVESSAAEILKAEAPTPPPAAPPVATPENSLAADDEGNGAVEDDGSVEDYMSQLLNRMRGDNEPTSGEVAEQNQDKAVEKITAQQQGEASQNQPAKKEKLTQEEFIPQQKAVRIQSLDSLRAIANSNAREAFQNSVAKERKVSTQTKLTLAVVSLGFGGLFFIMSFIAAKVNVWGVAFGLAFLLIGLYTMRTYLSERKLDRSILSD